MQMTDAQVFTLAIAIIVPLAALIHSNSRITDTRVALSKQIDELKDTLRAEIKVLSTEAQADIKALSVEMQAGFERLEAALKIHELEHHRH